VTESLQFATWFIHHQSHTYGIYIQGHIDRLPWRGLNKGRMFRVRLGSCPRASLRFPSCRLSSTLHQPNIRSPEAIASDYALQHGYDPNSFWRQPVSWGNLDSFRHLNNVCYVRFFESGRMEWLRNLAIIAGGEHRAKDLLEAKGISLILKSINVNFRRPVSFPDTLLVAHKALPPTADPAHLSIHAMAYSETQGTIVAESTAICVWYDYDTLSKCRSGPPVEFKQAFQHGEPDSEASKPH